MESRDITAGTAFTTPTTVKVNTAPITSHHRVGQDSMTAYSTVAPSGPAASSPPDAFR
ncbi:MAG: hypothetical protein QGG24_03040 [Vicinamibacterales bacterium]|nr:hypothetical protein [Vicinamibacterales bacterium]